MLPVSSAGPLIDFYEISKPQITWEMDKKSFYAIRALRDELKQSVCDPHLKYRDMHGTILGVPVVVLDVPGVRLRYTFDDGVTYVKECDPLKIGI